MPFIELLAPPLPPSGRKAVTEVVTRGICDAFSVAAETVTLYFLDIGEGQYAHAGRAGTAEAPQRVFIKIHAYRRGVAERRCAADALTPDLARLYGIPSGSLAIYFLERTPDEVAHDGRLSSGSHQA